MVTVPESIIFLTIARSAIGVNCVSNIAGAAERSQCVVAHLLTQHIVTAFVDVYRRA